MNTRKLIALVMALCLTLVCAGAMAETVTLKIAHNYDFVTIPNSVIAAAERLEERYAAEGKDIQIEFEQDYQRIDWGEYSKNLIFAYKNGDAPDIFSVADVPSMVDVGMLMDISDLNTDAFVDGVFECYMVDGKAYAMPFDLPVRVIYYNKLSLVEYGWTMEEAEALPAKVAAGEFTWEQFVQLCDDIQNAGVCTWGMAHRPGAGSDFLDVLQTLGGRYYDENGTLVFDEDAMLRFFQFMYDAANVTEITPHDLAQQGWPSINTMVGDGTCFAYYGPIYSSTYVASAVNKDPQQFSDDVAFMMFPVSEYSDKPFVIAAPQGMGINAATKYPDICHDLLEELANGSADLLADHADTIFTLSSVKAANEMEAITTNPIVADVGYMADYAISVPSINGINTLNSEMLNAIVQLELGQITPEQAVENVKIQLELNLDEDEIIFE